MAGGTKTTTAIGPTLQTGSSNCESHMQLAPPSLVKGEPASIVGVERRANRGGVGLEGVACGPWIGPGSCADREAVASDPREDVQVRVEDLLEGGLAIGQEQVYAVAWHPGRAESRAEPGGHREDVGGEIFGDLVQKCEVRVGDDHEVPGRDGIVVEEARHAVVAIDDAGRRPSACDVTEDAVVQ